MHAGKQGFCSLSQGVLFLFGSQAATVTSKQISPLWQVWGQQSPELGSLGKLKDRKKWDVPMTVLLTMVHFYPLRFLSPTFLVYAVHTSVFFCLFLWVHLCPCKGPAVLISLLLPCCKGEWTGNMVGSVSRCRSCLFYSAAGRIHKCFGKPGVHGYVIALGWTAAA